MRAEVEHMKAKVVEAEAEVPKAMAEAPKPKPALSVRRRDALCIVESSLWE